MKIKFSDVPDNAWFKALGKDLKKIGERRATTGITEWVFSPGDIVEIIDPDRPGNLDWTQEYLRYYMNNIGVL